MVIDLTLASSGGGRGTLVSSGTLVLSGTLVSSGTLVGLPRIVTHAYKNLRLRPSVAC